MPHINTPQSRCRFGISREDITPPVGIYHRMWGAATHERATGIHRPLTATVAALQSARPGDEGELLLIALDHCLFLAREMDQFLDRVVSAAAVPRAALIVAFSHTHGAGLMDTDRALLPGGELIGPYLETLAATVSRMVRAAQQGVQPAAIVYGYGRCGLAGQRDFADAATGQWVCGFNPAATADDTLLVARVTDDRGAPLATFVNYACHPTTLAFENTLISPDFPGAMREVIERQTGAPCVFLQGASGDLGPREGYVGGTQVADRNGRQLGFAALAALEPLPPPQTRFEYAGPVVSGATLGIWKHVPLSSEERTRGELWRCRQWTVPLRYRPGLSSVDELQAERLRHLESKETALRQGDSLAARDAHALIERVDRQLRRLASLPPGDEFPLPVCLWQMGDALWLAVEGEHYQFLQQALRRRFPDLPLTVITLANGSRPAYLPTAGIYDTGMYQETIALLARGSLERLVDAIDRQICEWMA
ncbi:MAG: hypothetical protein ACKV0T_30700 [Planctomycetales bacterium]